MEVLLKYTKDDWKIFQSFLQKDLCKSTTMWYERAWVNVILWFTIAVVFLTFFQSTSEFSWPTASIVVFFFIFLFTQVILSGIKLKKLSAPSNEGIFIGEHCFKFDEKGVHSRGKGYSASHSWSVVKRAVKTDVAIYLFLDNAYIFPSSQLEDPDKFYEYVGSQIELYRANKN
jgi:hypothetical protein